MTGNNSDSIGAANLRYEFFTPHFRGFDLVWDFLCDQGGSFSDGILAAKGSYGYERARDLKLFADGVQIGHHTELWERFAALGPVFQRFWRTFEQRAAAWQKERGEPEISASAERKRLDDALCARVLTAALATEAQRAETTKIGSVHEGAGPQGQRP